jgi:hypothetical protein
MRELEIDGLSEEELVKLNHRIVARLRFLSAARSHQAMMGFRIGERVKFHPDGRGELLGVVTRYNKKTLTVITDSGEHWTIPPRMLSRVEVRAAGAGEAGKAGISSLQAPKSDPREIN